MSEDQRPGKPLVWGIVGFVIGAYLGLQVGNLVHLWIGLPLQIIGAVVGGVGVGMLAFTASKKNNGAPPSWLWRSKKK